MPNYKKVNGVRVELSDQEWEDIKAERATNRSAATVRRNALAARKAAAIVNASTVASVLGITVDELKDVLRFT